MISIGVEVRPSLYGTARPGRPRRCSDCVGLLTSSRSGRLGSHGLVLALIGSQLRRFLPVEKPTTLLGTRCLVGGIAQQIKDHWADRSNYCRSPHPRLYGSMAHSGHASSK